MDAVQVQLYVEGAKSGEPFEIEPVPHEIADLKKAVIAENDDLRLVPARLLSVYKPGTDRPEGEKDLLRGNSIVSEEAEGSSYDLPLRVFVAPQRQQQQQNEALEEEVTKRPATLVSRARFSLHQFSAEDLIQLRNERDNRGLPSVHKEPDSKLDFVGRAREQGELQDALTPALAAARDDKKTKVVVEYATISGAGKTRWLFQAFKKFRSENVPQLTSSVVHFNFNGADGSNDCREAKKAAVQPEGALARLLLSRGLFECAPDLTWMGRGPIPDNDLPPLSVIVDALFKSLFDAGKGLLVVHLDELHIFKKERIADMARLHEAENVPKARAKALAENEVFAWIKTFLGLICGLSDHTKGRHVVAIITHTSPSGQIIGPDSISSLAYKPLRLYPLTMDQSWELLNAARRKHFGEREDWEEIEGRIPLDGTIREKWTPCIALAGGHPSLLLDSFTIIIRTLVPSYNPQTWGQSTGQLVTNHRVENAVNWDTIEVELAKTFVGKALRMDRI